MTIEEKTEDGSPRCQEIFRLYINGTSRPAQCRYAAILGKTVCDYHMKKAEWRAAQKARKGTTK